MRILDRLTEQQRRVLQRLHARDQEERLAGDRSPDSLKAVSPEVAELLFSLVVGAGARNIFEFGTSHGYSTIHLAAAAQITGGRVFSVDRLAAKTSAAAGNLQLAGLAERAHLVTGDGLDLLERHSRGIDFAFLDYDAADFLPAVSLLEERMVSNAILFADGGPEGYWKRDGVRELIDALDGDERFVYSFLPMRKRELIAVKIEP